MKVLIPALYFGYFTWEINALIVHLIKLRFWAKEVSLILNTKI